jgi:protein-S-isoprenylcysteine O-methyltransferase Ste14
MRAGQKAVALKARLQPVPRLASLFIGMIGLRLDRAGFNPVFIIWAILFAAGGLAYGQLFVWGGLSPVEGRPYAIVYALISWLVYYGGLSLLLGTSLRRRLLARFGRERVLKYFNPAMGIVFQHQGLAQAAIIDCWIGTMGVAPSWLLPSGLVLILLGTGVKLWATHATSLDVYYYIDMLTDEPGHEGELVQSGPFRWFRNPMYGVGNLQGYGSALLVASWPGLLVAAVFQASVYVFYFAIERPYLRRAMVPLSVRD